MSDETQMDLTLRDIAMMAAGFDLTKDGMERLHRFLTTHPLFAEQISELQRLARIAEYDPTPDNLIYGLDAQVEFDELLAAKDWKHPGEALGRDLEHVFYSELIGVANDRIEHAEDPEQLIAVRDRLVRQQAEKRELEDLSERGVDCVSKLDPKDAERILGQIKGSYRLRLREAKAKTA